MLRLKACFLTAVFLLGAVFFFTAHKTRSSSSVVRLTHTADQAVNLNPSLSDDGRVVVFESSADLAAGGPSLGSGLDSSFHAVRANVGADPPAFTDIGSTRVVSPALSSDGSVVAFASTEDLLGENADRNSEIFIATVSGLRQITHTSPGASETRLSDGNSQPSIMSDGSLVAFTSRGNLLLYDVAIGAISHLTEGSNPKLSGHGSRLYYQRGADLVSRDLKTKTSRVIAADVPGVSITTGRAVSNDGLRFVYAAEVAPNQSQVFLYDERENTIRQLTRLGSRSVDVALQPTISGDGKRVAFATRRRVTNASDGSVELYVYDIPSGQTQQVTNAPAGATAGVVASLNFDGSLVAFSFPRSLSGPAPDNDLGNNNEIYLASLIPRPQFGVAAVLNAAALGNEPAQPATLAPGSIATLRGSALAFRTETQISANPPAALAGTTVKVNGQAARIFYASPDEVIFVVPEGLAAGPAEVIVSNSDSFTAKATALIAGGAPGIFTGNGDGAGEAIILDSDAHTAGPFDPANGRLRLSIFATGVSRAGNVTAAVNSQPVTVETIASSVLPGLDEIHVLVPAELRGAGTSTLTVTADGVQSNPVTLTIGGSALRDVVINEILADPPDGLAGDANRDGIRDTADDEFIELVNSTTHDLDLSGFQLQTRALTGATDTLRHRFATGTILPAGTALVIFGGGSLTTASSLPAASLFDASIPAPGRLTAIDFIFGDSQVVKASTGGLSLTNSGAVVTLRSATGEVITSVTYGSAVGRRGDLNQSLTRSPDLTGNFSPHSTAPGSENRPFSPGTKLDGSLFIRTP
ncbi:MAG TPA: lamin tail domain-containing protein, partial [Pyrinomonadaceae bacterium]|nr:lamin tail domain-containing protein [Pyrinomonadaceae bacterium]